MDQKNLADLYKLAPIPWSGRSRHSSRASRQNETSFLATTRPDGRPHVAGVGAIWDNGKVYVVSGARDAQEQEPRQRPELRHRDVPDGHRPRHRGHGRAGDRRRDPPTPGEALWRHGLAGDGRGRRVHLRLQRAERGPAAWNLYAITPTTVFGVLSAEPGGATRWRF